MSDLKSCEKDHGLSQRTKGIFFSNNIKPEDNATIKKVYIHSIAGAQTGHPKVPSSETKSRQIENDRSLSASS